MSPITIYLQPNPITPDPNDQSARVAPHTVLGEDDIINLMLKRGTSFTAPDIRGILNLFADVVGDEVAGGNHVNLPLAKIRPSVSGVFTSKSDNFDRSRHTLRATCSTGTGLSKKMNAATVEKISQPLPEPVLLEFTDATTGSHNNVVTPGGIGTIIGEELKFDLANEDEGIYLVDATGNENRVTVIAYRTEGKLMFNVPGDLPTGEYSLQVRRAYGANAAIRTGELNEPLVLS